MAQCPVSQLKLIIVQHFPFHGLFTRDASPCAPADCCTLNFHVSTTRQRKASGKIEPVKVQPPPSLSMSAMIQKQLPALAIPHGAPGYNRPISGVQDTSQSRDAETNDDEDAIHSHLRRLSIPLPYPHDRSRDESPRCCIVRGRDRCGPSRRAGPGRAPGPREQQRTAPRKQSVSGPCKPPYSICHK